jgi:hypothetical protein
MPNIYNIDLQLVMANLVFLIELGLKFFLAFETPVYTYFWRFNVYCVISRYWGDDRIFYLFSKAKIVSLKSQVLFFQQH